MSQEFKPHTSLHRYQIGGTFLFSIACIFLTLHCGKTKDAFPQKLLGKWTTEAERYQDRYIEFRGEMIIFGTGDDTPNIFFTREVKQKRNGAGNEYMFMCNNEVDTEFIFDFFIDGVGDALTMRLKNPREVTWEKETGMSD